MKICVVTGSRAEYGLFYPLLKRFQNDPLFDLQIVVTGMHLSAEFGLTYKEIEKDGFTISKRAEILLSSDSEVGVSKSIGLGIIDFSGIFRELEPDLTFLLGDRFETFAAAVSAHIAGVPIAHLHGGELTEGAFDDAFRHCITKMSYLHFTSTETYWQRVIQLGESPERVFNVGALGIDNIKKTKLMPKKQLEEALEWELTGKIVMVTYHPVTLEKGSSVRQFEKLLSAVKEFDDLKLVITKPNADPEGRNLIKTIDSYVKNHPDKAKAFVSLGRVKYLSCLKYAALVIGNSSSGIIEVPSFAIPTVNIGNRQKGRIRADSVIDCDDSAPEIKKAIQKALSRDFRKLCANSTNPYGSGQAADKIIDVTKKWVDIDTIKKSFYDISFSI